MASTVYFGNTEKFQEVKAMLSELPAASGVYSTQQQFQNGGASVRTSFGRHRVFDMSWTGDADETGLIKDYAQGYYGNGLIYFTLPHIMKRNVFAPNWAAPRLINVESNGWPEIYDGTATFATTSSLLNNQPILSATYSVTNTVPFKKFIIPIPALRTLYLGWTGSSTGTGVVAVRPIVAATGAYASVTNLTAIAPSSTTRMNANFNGATYSAVEVYLTATSGVASTVTVASLMGQLIKTGVTPTLTGNFQPGRGFSGFVFTDGITESIIIDNYDNTERISISATLTEVGQWQRT